MLQCCTGPSSDLPEMRPIQPFNCQEYNQSVQVLYCTVLFSFHRCQMTVWRLADQPYNPHRTEVEALSIGLIAGVVWVCSPRPTHCKLADVSTYLGLLWYSQSARNMTLVVKCCEPLHGEILNQDWQYVRYVAATCPQGLDIWSFDELLLFCGHEADELHNGRNMIMLN